MDTIQEILNDVYDEGTSSLRIIEDAGDANGNDGSVQGILTAVHDTGNQALKVTIS